MDMSTPAQQQLLQRLDEAIEDMTSFRAGIAVARREIAAFMKANFGVSRPDPTNMVNARLRIMFQQPDARTARLLEEVAFVQWTEGIRALLSDAQACAELANQQPEIQDLMSAFMTDSRFRAQQKRAFTELSRINRYLPESIQARTRVLQSASTQTPEIA